MKPTRAWAVVYRTGDVWFLELKHQEAKDRFNEYHVNGNIRIARVEIRELAPKSRKR